MKNKWKWIYNPFEFIAGWKAFGIGVVILCITTIIGYFGNFVFYVLNINTVSDVTLGMAFVVQTLSLIVMVALMYVAALFFAKHVRFQDILGTVTLAKYPLLIAALLLLVFNKPMMSFIKSIDLNKIMNNEFIISDYTSFYLVSLFGLIALIVMIWEIALIYNAFRVSTNFKGTKCAL